MMPPMRVSIELVPRDRASLLRQLDEVLSHLPAAGAINVPDLLRFDLRSWDAASDVCGRCRELGRSVTTIPHLRAMDVDPACPMAGLEVLDAAGVREVIVVQGDPPPDMRHRVGGATTVQVIERLRRERPGWRIYAALDPYRQGIAQERDYALRKLDAGADGFFTQPFFDLDLLRAWHALLPDVPTFWGVTSVTSVPSMRYWTSRNRAVFPRGFEPTLAWHRSFADEVLTYARAEATDLYFMPIRVPIAAWLGDLLDG